MNEDPPNGFGSAGTLEGIDHPGINDVMFGRGGETNYHIGNHRFRVLADDHRDEYRSSSRKEKADVVQKVVSIWRDRGGRFLTKTDPELGDASLWHDVGDEVAKKKAAKILSEKTLTRRQRNEGNSSGSNTARSTASSGNSTSSINESNNDTTSISQKRKPDNAQDIQERPPKTRAAAGNPLVSSGVTVTSANAAVRLAPPLLAMPAALTEAASGHGIGSEFMVPNLNIFANLDFAVSLPRGHLHRLPSLASSTSAQLALLAQLRASVPTGLSANPSASLSPLDLSLFRNDALMIPELNGSAVNHVHLLNRESLAQMALMTNPLIRQEQHTRAQQIVANAIMQRSLNTLEVNSRLQGISAEHLLQLVQRRQGAAATEESKSSIESETIRNSNNDDLSSYNNDDRLPPAAG